LPIWRRSIWRSETCIRDLTAVHAKSRRARHSHRTHRAFSLFKQADPLVGNNAREADSVAAWACRPPGHEDRLVPFRSRRTAFSLLAWAWPHRCFPQSHAPFSTYTHFPRTRILLARLPHLVTWLVGTRASATSFVLWWSFIEAIPVIVSPSGSPPRRSSTRCATGSMALTLHFLLTGNRQIDTRGAGTTREDARTAKAAPDTAMSQFDWSSLVQPRGVTLFDHLVGGVRPATR
jgi:hypothetical protein